MPEAASPSPSITSLLNLASLFVYASNASVLPKQCKLHENTSFPSSLFSLPGYLQHLKVHPENIRYPVNTCQLTDSLGTFTQTVSSSAGLLPLQFSLLARDVLKEDKRWHLHFCSKPRHHRLCSGMSVCCRYSKSGVGEFVWLTSATFGPLTHVTSKNKKDAGNRGRKGTSMCQDARQSFPSIISPESPSSQGAGVITAILQTRKLRLREFKQPAQGHTAGGTGTGTLDCLPRERTSVGP